MATDEQAGRRLSFGVFALDLRAGELRKRGLRVRLQFQGRNHLVCSHKNKRTLSSFLFDCLRLFLYRIYGFVTTLARKTF